MADALKALALNAFFLPVIAKSASDIFPFNAAAWSLSLEWAINLVYAFYAVRLRTGWLVILAFAAAIGLIFLALDYHSLDMGWGVSTAAGGVLRICFSFTLGVIIYRLLAAGKLRLPALNPLLLLTGLVFCLVTPLGKAGVGYDLLCAMIIFPLFVGLACQSQTPAVLIPSFDMLGRLSYAVYILHTPMMLWFGGVWKILTHSEPAEYPFLSGIPLIAGIILASYLAVRLYDEPLRRMLTTRKTEISN